jgi:hypothetical protein
LRRGLGWSEETITDTLLLEISKRHPYDVYTVKFNKRIEAQEGADWEWVILSKSGILRLRFQAKKLHIVGNAYEYSTLDYKIRGSKPQVEALIERAENTGAFPLYMFYNIWDIDFIYSNLVRHVDSVNCCRRWRGDFGVTIASAYEIERLLSQNPPQKTLSSVLRVSWPLNCLGCCRFSDLSESIYKFILRNLIKEARDNVFGDIFHAELPKDLIQKLKGKFEEEVDPIFTTFIVDRENPHEQFKIIKQIFSE